MSMEDRPIFCRNCGTRLDPVSGECPKCSPRPAMPSQHLRSGYKQNFCTECGSRLDPATGRCPNPWCSQGLPAKPRPHRGKTLLICLLLLLLAGSGICLYFFYPRLLTAMENREWLQSADDMTTETWVPKESEEPHISETHPKETVTKEQPVQETYQEESEIETVSSEELEKTQILLQAKDYLNQHQYRQAIQLVDEAYLKFGDEEFRQLAGNYRMAFGKYFNTIFAAGKYNSAVLQDGYVRVVGDDEYGESGAESWFDVTSVSVGDRFVMGLHSNGTVSIIGHYANADKVKNLGWRDIVAISAGDCHAVGLTSYGTVVAEGNNYFGQSDVHALYQKANGQRIVAISAGYTHTLALLEDGSVVACGETTQGACDVENWHNVAAIYTGTRFSAALLTDGTVRVTGQYASKINAYDWQNIESLAAGDHFLTGIRSDGTVISAALDEDNKNESNEGQLETQNLHDIVALAAGHNHLLALDSNGALHALGWNARGACDLDGFSVKHLF